ncbi:hypothetical protein BBR47_01240 [Brevibacillus brevis NBRC 100599]|uniref:Uncharacterized protein n=1 Tax=Brevibacillus brevis (strain 47 / JCM 6285 / NBRC 100599) TaxID=358681 RepID=C0ZHG0_BREBN|nr:hypothetical protein BBR47_01240 [Brevibacillus brevis NBRC 100599]
MGLPFSQHSGGEEKAQVSSTLTRQLGDSLGVST